MILSPNIVTNVSSGTSPGNEILRVVGICFFAPAVYIAYDSDQLPLTVNGSQECFSVLSP